MSEVVKVRKMIGIAFGVIFLLVGMGIVGYYAKMEIDKWKTDGIYEQTEAEVIGYEYSREGQAAVVVEYAVNNKTYTLISNCYSSIPERIGEQIKVQYDRRYPRKAILISENNDIIVFVIGIIFVVASAYVIWYASRETEKEIDWVIYRGSVC